MDFFTEEIEHLELVRIRDPLESSNYGETRPHHCSIRKAIEQKNAQRCLVELIYLAAAAERSHYQLTQLQILLPEPENILPKAKLDPIVTIRLSEWSHSGPPRSLETILQFVETLEQELLDTLKLSQSITQFFEIFGTLREYFQQLCVDQHKDAVQNRTAVIDVMQQLAVRLEKTTVFSTSSKLLLISHNMNFFRIRAKQQMLSSYQEALQTEKQLKTGSVTNFLRDALPRLEYAVNSSTFRLFPQTIESKFSLEAKLIIPGEKKEGGVRTRAAGEQSKRQRYIQELLPKVEAAASEHILSFEVLMDEISRQFTIFMNIDIQVNSMKSDLMNYSVLDLNEALPFRIVIIQVQGCNYLHLVYSCQLGESPLTTTLQVIDMLIIGKICLTPQLDTQDHNQNLEKIISRFNHYWNICQKVPYQQLLN